jgi:hypothetical protein
MHWLRQFCILSATVLDHYRSQLLVDQRELQSDLDALGMSNAQFNLVHTVFSQLAGPLQRPQAANWCSAHLAAGTGKTARDIPSVPFFDPAAAWPVQARWFRRVFKPSISSWKRPFVSLPRRRRVFLHSPHGGRSGIDGSHARILSAWTGAIPRQLLKKGKSIMSKPSHFAYIVPTAKEGKKAIWHRIGAIWPHRNGNGFDLVIPDGISVTGRIVCTSPKEDEIVSQ